jgi:hypothetical protein
MTASSPVLGGRTGRLLGLWAGFGFTRVAQGLLLGAIVALPLSAAATLTVSFTLTLSQVLAAAAVSIGALGALRGWLALPRRIAAAAATLVAAYLASALLGVDAGVPGQTARAGHRDLVYIADMVTGLAAVGLLVDARGTRFIKKAVACFAVAGVAAALYAIYQWFAQHYGWPLADLNNAVNSDGFTLGHVSQGAGLFGWERVRGTFKEPLFLGSFLVITLPFVGSLWFAGSRRLRPLVAAGIGAIAVALLLTVSTLAWGTAVVATLVVALILAIEGGHVRAAAAVAAVGAVVAIAAPIMFADPAALSGLTGRSDEALQTTSANRVDAWRSALRRWELKPVLGFGPGQSAVQLAYRPTVLAKGGQPIVYGSAQGLWAASLVDAGLIGLFGWTAVLASLLAYAIRGAFTTPRPLLLGGVAASVVAVLVGQLSADRFDIRVWLALGIMASAARYYRGEPSSDQDEQAQQASAQHPRTRMLR